MTPQDLGLPIKAFRPQQKLAIERTATALQSPSSQGIVGVSAPTGSGKSWMAVAWCRMHSGRRVISTGSKALQDQYQTEAGPLGLLDMRGRNNYECEPTEASCDIGRIARCSDQRTKDGESEPRCPYVAQYNRCMEPDAWYAPNFHYLIEMQKRDYRLGVHDLQILDEAHELDAVLTGAAAVRLTERELAEYGINKQKKPETAKDWAIWAGDVLPRMLSRLQEAYSKQSASEVRKLEDLSGRLSMLAEAGDGWAVDEQDAGGVKMEPIDIGPYAQKWLFDSAALSVLMSGTLTKETLKQLGFSAFSFIDVPTDFDPKRSPFYTIPRVNLTQRTMTSGDLSQLALLCNQIIGRRLDRKGVIHSVSYDRAHWLSQKSPFREHMIVHRRGQPIREVVEQYRSTPAPCVLVSPSVMTGYDFPGDQCDWQILLKLPYPDNRGSKNLMKARRENLPNYSFNEVAQKTVQVAGRGTRSKDDYCETFLFDKMAEWLVPKSMKLGLYPKYFTDRIVTLRERDRLPNPIEK